MSTVQRYTAEQLLKLAEYLESPLSAPAYGECMRMASMLRQAATDATRLQSLEAENARLRKALEEIEPMLRGNGSWC